jgi:hypothetical protein
MDGLSGGAGDGRCDVRILCRDLCGQSGLSNQDPAAFAGTNMLLFHWYTRQGLHHWDHVSAPPGFMRAAGGASMVFWAGVITAGRWIGF